MGRSPSRLRRQILLPVAGAALLVLAIFIYGFHFLLEATIHTEFARDAQGLKAFWDAHAARRTEQLSHIGETIAADPVLRQFLEEGNRTGLAAHAAQLHARLRAEFGANLFAILDPDRNELVRAGAAVDGQRRSTLTVAAVAALGAVATELDVCEHGDTAVRAAVPVRDGGRTLGFVVVGAMVGELLEEMDALFGVRHLLLIDRRYLAARGVDRVRIADGTPYGPEAFPAFIPVHGTAPRLPATVTAALRGGRLEMLAAGIVAEDGGRELVSGLLPLINSGGDVIGQVLVLRDISPRHELFTRTATITMGAAVGLSVLVFGVVFTVTSRAQTEFDGFYARLERAHRDWMESIDAIREPIFLHDGDYRIVRGNRAYATRAGMDPEAMVGRPYWEVFPKSDGPMAVCRQVMEEHRHGSFDERLRIDSGETFLARAFPIYDDEGQFRFSVHIFEDVTQYEATMERLRREVRARRTISRSNNALVRAQDEAELLETICAIITEVGGYPMAWVGMKRADLGQRIEPVASSGIELQALDQLGLTWAIDAEPRSLASEVIRSGEMVVRQDSGHTQGDVRVLAERLGCRAAIGYPLKLRGDTFGCLVICGAEPNAFSEEETGLLGELAGDLAFGLGALRSRGQLDRAETERMALLRKLEDSLAKTVQAMANALEARDPYTAGHQRRVAELAVAIARELELPEEQVEAVRIAAVVHDVGKIYVPAELLSKPGRLTPLEYELVKTHAQVSYEILKDIDFPWPIADIVHQHHERLDGSGYPHGLVGDAILPEARILAVADVIEAMGTHRPYRPALSAETALAEIESHRGTRYDAAVVDACTNLFRRRGYSLDA